MAPGLCQMMQKISLSDYNSSSMMWPAQAAGTHCAAAALLPAGGAHKDSSSTLLIPSLATINASSTRISTCKRACRVQSANVQCIPLSGVGILAAHAPARLLACLQPPSAPQQLWRASSQHGAWRGINSSAVLCRKTSRRDSWSVAPASPHKPGLGGAGAVRMRPAVSELNKPMRGLPNGSQPPEAVVVSTSNPASSNPGVMTRLWAAVQDSLAALRHGVLNALPWQRIARVAVAGLLGVTTLHTGVPQLRWIGQRLSLCHAVSSHPLKRLRCCYLSLPKASAMKQDIMFLALHRARSACAVDAADTQQCRGQPSLWAARAAARWAHTAAPRGRSGLSGRKRCTACDTHRPGAAYGTAYSWHRRRHVCRMGVDTAADVQATAMMHSTSQLLLPLLLPAFNAIICPRICSCHRSRAARRMQAAVGAADSLWRANAPCAAGSRSERGVAQRHRRWMDASWGGIRRSCVAATPGGQPGQSGAAAARRHAAQ